MNCQQPSRRNFLRLSAAGLAVSLLPSSVFTEEAALPWEKRFQLSAGVPIRVLQFTDVHFFNGVNKLPKQEARRRQKTLDDVRRLIDHAQPHLLFVTGDLWHDNPEGRGAEFMTYAVEQCASWGVPWAFAWGNHDQLDDYAVGHKTFSEARNSLYAGAGSDGNYVLTVEDAEGTALVQFFCLNSRNTGINEEARAFVARATDKLNERGTAPLRFGAFHIPLRHYEDIWMQGIASGIMGETVCYEQEDRAALPVFQKAGIQAVFCGHDHVNDYSGVLEGVDLIYGRATGHAGYGADKAAKGAKLYTIDTASRSYEWVSLLPDGSQWKPKPGERIERL